MRNLGSHSNIAVDWSIWDVIQRYLGSSYRRFECLFLHGEGPRSRCYGRTTALRLLCNPVMKIKMHSFFDQVLQVMEDRWNEIDKGKPKYSGKNLS
jgi:hypothetical protein